MFKKTISLFITLTLFTGCEDNAPQEIIISETSIGQEEHKPEPIVIEKIVYDNKVQKLLHLSQNCTLKDVTYICIGDSTRARTERYKAHIIFDKVAHVLDDYNVTSHLLARKSHTLKQFIHESISPTWSDTVDLIPNEGETTIVDISLGVNDFLAFDIDSTSQFDWATETIKDRLLEAITLIKVHKPKTTFMLTVPNPAIKLGEKAALYKKAYMEVAGEEHYVLINFVDDIMPKHDTSEFLDWYRDKIHFSEHGLHQVADYILLSILPKE